MQSYYYGTAKSRRVGDDLLAFQVSSLAKDFLVMFCM